MMPVLGLCFCMEILSGLPQYVLFAATTAGVFSIGPTWSATRDRLSKVAVAGMLGVILAAPALLPAGAYILADTLRGSPLPAALRGVDDLPPVNLLGYVSPLLFGGRGPGSLAYARTYWVTLHFVGTVTLALAVSAVTVYRSRAVLPALGLLVVGTSLGLGYHLPVLGPVLKNAFPLNVFRHSAMWMALTNLGLAWLAAQGAQALQASLHAGDGRGRPVAAIMATLGAAGAVLAQWGAGFRHLTPWLFHPLGFGLLGSALVWYATRPRARAVPALTALVVLSVLDLAGMAAYFRTSVESGWLRAASPGESFLHDQARTTDVSRSFGRVIHWPPATEPGYTLDEFVRGKDRAGVLANIRALLHPNLPSVAGWPQADGENPLMPRG
ncbi:MAG: hypothetical protein AAB368_11840, partial [bacterium]